MAMLLSILHTSKQGDIFISVAHTTLMQLLYPGDLAILSMFLVHSSIGIYIMDSLMQRTQQKVS